MCLLDILTGYVKLQLVVIAIKLIKPFYYCVCSAYVLPLCMLRT